MQQRIELLDPELGAPLRSGRVVRFRADLRLEPRVNLDATVRDAHHVSPGQVILPAQLRDLQPPESAVVLFLGNTGGLYAVGVGMMASFIFMVTGAWLLLVGVGTVQPSVART